MESVRPVLGVMLPYVAVVVFLVGMIWRIRPSFIVKIVEQADDSPTVLILAKLASRFLHQKKPNG